MTVEEKKHKIIKVAMKEFSRRGYSEAKISHIATEAGVATGSVYLYFNNKEKILEEIFMQSFSQVLNVLNDVYPKNISSEQKLRKFIQTVVLLASQQKELAVIMLHEYRFWNDGHSTQLNEIVREIRRIIKLILQEGKKENFRQETDPTSAGIFLLSGLWNLLAYKTHELNGSTFQKVCLELENLIIRGLK